ncbi:MAG: hypothetical protein RRY34_04675, partial [Victivallaceae bacterium]
KTPGHTNNITLKITSGGSLWFSNSANNWNSQVNDLGKYLDMGSGQYGAISSDGSITQGTGETKEFTFTNGKKEVNLTGYYVGDFKAGDEISFWVTKDGVQVGSTGDAQGSRLDKTDAVGNGSFNFGVGGGVGNIDFSAIGGDSVNNSTAPVGKPLPGVLSALLFSGAVVGIAGWKRKKNNC